MYKQRDINNVLWEIDKLQFKCWVVYKDDGYVKTFDSFPQAKAWVLANTQFAA